MKVIKLVGAIFLLQIVLLLHMQTINASFLLSKTPSLLSRSKHHKLAATTEGPLGDEGREEEPEVGEISSEQFAEETEKMNQSQKLDAQNGSEQTQTGSSEQSSGGSPPPPPPPPPSPSPSPYVGAYDKRAFVMELLRMLHEKYAAKVEPAKDQINRGEESSQLTNTISNKEDRHQPPISRRPAMIKLLEAISADGDMSRLIDWVQNSFNLASIGELTTQFVVSKLGSVNCAALFQPTSDQESLVPRFLLFNEHFTDVPYELSLTPTSNECLTQGRFDPIRKTVVLMHGYLSGYTLLDGMTNIKNRLLDLNKVANERAMFAFTEASRSNGSYVLTGDLETKLRRQKYNVIIVDWFGGANPIPRANYIQAAANARAVGELIAQFLVNLVTQCQTSSTQVQIIAHSLGCHVAGFTGKAMSEAGHTLGKITHLDPIGLCFGRLFSQPRFRLNPNDALDTHAVHVSLNLFDNPLDGARSNFLVNGGRDQAGCQGTSELRNSTTSSVSLLVDSGAKFSPCSHLRALSLFEDDLSSLPQPRCQIVGYRCATYERFLAGKCGKCDAANNQCRLMSFPPLMQQFSRIHLGGSTQTSGHTKAVRQIQWDDGQLLRASMYYNTQQYPQLAAMKNSTSLASNGYQQQQQQQASDSHRETPNSSILGLVRDHSNGSIAWVIDDEELNVRIGNVIAKMGPKLVKASESDETLSSGVGALKTGAKGSGVTPPEVASGNKRATTTTTTTSKKNPRYTIQGEGGDTSETNSQRRSDRRLISEHLIAQTLDKIRMETKNVLTGGWTNIKNNHPILESKYKVSSLFNLATAHQNAQSTVSLFSNLVIPKPTLELDHIQIPVNGFSGENLHSAQPEDLITAPAPIGSQPLPAGSSIGPLYFVGTSALSPYCVNYYQFRILIAESRIRKHLQSNGRTQQTQRMAHISSHGSHHLNSGLTNHNHKQQQQSGLSHDGQESGSKQQQQQQQKPRQATLSRDMLHLTVKLSDSFGHFFKGFTLMEDTRLLPRAPASELMGTRGPTSSETMVEMTLLLNTTNSEPVRVSETIISYYFHEIVLADTIEVNYMSNISPEIRARFSSILCPVAINDQHQLVRYIECNKVGAR